MSEGARKRRSRRVRQGSRNRRRARAGDPFLGAVVYTSAEPFRKSNGQPIIRYPKVEK